MCIKLLVFKALEQAVLLRVRPVGWASHERWFACVIAHYFPSDTRHISAIDLIVKKFQCNT